MSNLSSKNLALIFDLDGTLIHSVPDMHLAISKTLKEFNLGVISEQQLQLFVGQGLLKLSERVVKFCGGDQSLVEPVYKSYRENYSEVPYKFSRYMKGVENTIKTLFDRNIPMSICTNKRQLVTEKLLTQMNIDHYFKTIVGAQDGIPLKPNREMIDLVISKLNLDNFLYFMIGDTANDVEAARSAGIKSIIVSGGYTEQSVEDLNSDYILNDMGELSNFLEI